MKLGLLVAPDPEIGELAYQAERAGFDHLWVAEDHPTDAGLVQAAAVLAASSTAFVTTAFANVAIRDREVVLGEAHRLVMASAGRFELGIVPDEDFSRLWDGLRPTAPLWVRTPDGRARRCQDGAVAVIRDVTSDLAADLIDDEKDGLDTVILRGPFQGSSGAVALAAMLAEHDLGRWLQ